MSYENSERMEVPTDEDIENAAKFLGVSLEGSEEDDKKRVLVEAWKDQMLRDKKDGGDSFAVAPTKFEAVMAWAGLPYAKWGAVYETL